MTPLDLDAVTALDAAAQIHPWMRSQFEEELHNPNAHTWVLTLQGSVTAHLMTWVVTTEWHVLNVASHPQHQRQGLATALLHHGAAHALSRGCTQALLDVRRGNLAALALYTGLGFQRVGLRKKYYAPNAEDAVLMTAPLSGSFGKRP